MDAKLAYTIPEAVAASGIGRSKLYQLIKEGAIVPRKAGRRTLILTADLTRLIDNLPSAK